MSSSTRNRQSPDLVYFCHDPLNALVKIGHSIDVPARIDALRTANPVNLLLLGTLPGGRREEGRLHRFFAEEHYRGEWFHATDDLLRTVRSILLRRGSPLTVQAELTRRQDCRYGLRGVEVAVLGFGLARYAVASTSWNACRQLRLSLHPWGETERVNGQRAELGRIYSLAELVAARIEEPDGTLKDVAADQVYLMADWPVVCRCWCPD
jgi:hypothetical protein